MNIPFSSNRSCWTNWAELRRCVKVETQPDAVIDDNPRATTHPSTLELIARVGLIDQFIKEGLVARYFQFWNKLSWKRLEERDPKTRAAQFDLLRATAVDPKGHKEFLLRTSLIASVRKSQSIA
jgi:hypothetical protein